MTDRDYVGMAADYQADVLAGRISACRYVKEACERNRRDLDRQDTDGFPFRFDPIAARRICQMAEMLPHIKGPKAVIIGRYWNAGRTLWPV
jgi:phage terminase large subunit-like protein